MCVRVRVQACSCVCMCVCAYEYIYTYSIRPYDQGVSKTTYVCAFACVHVCACMYLCVYLSQAHVSPLTLLKNGTKPSKDSLPPPHPTPTPLDLLILNNNSVVAIKTQTSYSLLTKAVYDEIYIYNKISSQQFDV